MNYLMRAPFTYDLLQWWAKAVRAILSNYMRSILILMYFNYCDLCLISILIFQHLLIVTFCMVSHVSKSKKLMIMMSIEIDIKEKTENKRFISHMNQELDYLKWLCFMVRTNMRAWLGYEHHRITSVSFFLSSYSFWRTHQFLMKVVGLLHSVLFMGLFLLPKSLG